MDLSQLIELAAKAMYDAWMVEENQRRREERARRAQEFPRRGSHVLPLDLPWWEGIPNSQREAFRMRARPVVLALEQEGKLNVGDEQWYDVEVDDPDLARKYTYTVPAMSAQAAACEAARRAIRQDPLKFLRSWRGDKSGMPFPGFPPPFSDDDELQLESPALIEAVALHTRVRRARAEEPEGWVEGEALWLGYRT